MVVRMEQGTLLQHQLPLHSDYNGLPIAPDCVDHCGPTQGHEAYNQHGVVDSLRRDNALGQQLPGSYHFAATHANGNNRFISDRATGDAGSYQTTSNFTDSSSGSISTSPSSAASSLAYTSYPGSHHYTSIQQFPTAAVQLPQGFVQSTYSGGRSASMIDTTTQSMLPPPTRSSLSTLTNASDTHATSTSYLARTPLSSAGFASYSSYPETPRSVVQATAQLSLSPGGSPYSTHHMASTNQQSYGTTALECANFPWSDLEALVDMNCDGQLLVPKISAKVEKGFFQAPGTEKRWTCYRRNYFSVACSFELRPNVSNGRITIRRDNVLETVQAMGMRLSAAVDGKDGKNIELVQHTPKRDAGPKTKIDICKVAPTPCNGRVDQSMQQHYQVGLTSYHNGGQLPGPYLPLQHIPEPGDTQAGASQDGPAQYAYTAPGQTPLLGGQGTTHTFERVQFKQATANNGKRRATQQFFHLIVELYADIRKEGSENPAWIKVAQRMSEKIVVRGRSPSHYSNEKVEGHHSVGGRGSTSSVGYGSGAASYGSMNAGGFRGLTNPYGNTNPHRRGDLQYSDHGSQSDSSGSSLEEGPMDTTYQADSVMSNAERLALHEHEGYTYYPSTLYENVHQNGSMLPPLAKLDGSARYMDETKNYAVKAEYSDAIAGAQYQANNCGRFQGVETSRGYFPDNIPRF